MGDSVIRCTNVREQNRDFRFEVFDAWRRILDTGQFILGPETDRLENWFSDRCDGANAIAVNSGTDALKFALQAVGVQSGDEVITVANSFVATVASVIDVGGSPVLTDVRPDETIDVESAAQLIGTRTRAILAVHLRGRPCQLDALRLLCDEHRLRLVEDCAQAIGTHINGIRVGTYGDASAFSLHPLKALGGAGDGGMVVTHSDEVARRIRLSRNHGLSSRDTVEVFGGNSRLDELQAAVINIKSAYIDGWIRRRRHIANYYNGAFENTPLCADLGAELSGNSYYHYVVAYRRRDELQKSLMSRGIETLIHYPIPVHRQKAWIDRFPEVSLPVTEKLADEILTIPCHPSLADREVEFVASSIRACVM